MIGQILVYGLIIGALYALVAAGLSLLLGVMRYLNIAHGTFIMLGGYLSYWAFAIAGLSPITSLPLVVAAMFGIGLILYQSFLSRLTKVSNLGQRIGASMLLTFGLSWVLDNLMTFLWTADVRSITTGFTGQVLTLGSLKIPCTGLFGLLLSLLAISFLHLLLAKTYLGKSIRAITQDWEAASLMGININQTYLLSTGIAMALNGVAGAVILSVYSVTPSGGLEWLMKAFLVMILAGEGRIKGLLAAGILLGLIESLSISLTGPAYREVTGLVVFVLALLWRPQGLFSARPERGSL